MRTYALVGVLLLADLASAQTVLDILPDTTGIGIALTGIDLVKKKGESFLKRTDYQVGLKPSDALDWGMTFIGLKNSPDYNGPAAIFWNRPDLKETVQLDNLIRRVVVAAPIKDAAALAKEMKLEKASLEKGEVLAKQKDNFVGAVHLDGKFAYFGENAGNLKDRAKAGPLSKALSDSTRTRFGGSDILIIVAPPRMDNDFVRTLIGQVSDKISTQKDPDDERIRNDLVEAIKETKFMLAGVRLEDHLEINASAILDGEKPAARDFLKRLADEGKPSNVRGLPEGRLLIAQAHAGEGRTTATLGKLMFETLIRESFEAGGFVSPSDRTTYSAVFGEMWGKMKASRLGAYVPKEGAPGAVSTVGIFDVEDPKAFLAEMKTLARIADGSIEDLTRPDAPEKLDLDKLVADLGNSAYRIRQSANTKLLLLGEPALSRLRKAETSDNVELAGRARKLREQIEAVVEIQRKSALASSTPLMRPRFTFVAGAEKRQETSIDVVKIRLVNATEAAVKQMTFLLGPDWDKMRIAVVGKQIVVGLGSDVEPFESALANVRGNRAGLEASKHLESFRKFASPNRSAEFHVSLEPGLEFLTKGTIPREFETHGVTSLGIAADASGLHLEMTAPPRDVKTVLTWFRW
ncbi:MAG: hypothetical protein K2X38_24715 [Gemmataceae bacterium]|nr:hypothetical protein [Gemmataceae bacterium]